MVGQNTGVAGLGRGQRRLKTVVQPAVAVAALLLFGLLPRTGHCQSIDWGHGLRPTLGTSGGFTPAYRLDPVIDRKELYRNQGYARLVWLPNATTAQIGRQQVYFGLATLTPAFRQALNAGDRPTGMNLVPVVSLPVHRNVNMTLIPNFGGSTKGLVALQLKLGG